MRGAVVTIEQAHRYPSHVKLLLELAAAIAVIVALALLLYDLARLFFEVLGTSTLMTLFPQFPQVRDWIMYVAVRPWPCCSDPLPKLPALLPHLVLFALALFGALLLRFGLPTVRTSARGVLVEFAGGWLPIPWESIVTIKVTEAGEKFVLLIQTDGKHLTGWHRFYSLLYSLSFRPGFLVTSAISDFDGLAKTLLSEADRVARLLDKRGAKLQEEEFIK